MERLTPDSEVFIRAVESVVTRDELAGRLAAGKPLRIKHGIDATSPDLHVGHAASLWKIRTLQEAGHKAVILLGDYTTRIGDPTGKSKTRPVLSAKDIDKNAASIEKQVKKILLSGTKNLEMHRSSEWYGKMKLEKFFELLAMITHARLIERDMFRKRIEANSEIHMHELIYPVLQGYDSVMLNADMTVIGSDQLFNEHMGRLFQERFGQRPQVLVALKILPGLDGGEKMSKSLGNAIALADSPTDKFGKAMRLLDALIVPYLETYTDMPTEKIEETKAKLQGGGNPKDAKLDFAEALVRRYHGHEVARKARESFHTVHSEKGIPSDMPEVELAPLNQGWPPIKLLTDNNLASSNSEARRLILQGAVEIDGEVIRDPTAMVVIKHGTVIRVGKHKFLKVK